MTHTLAMEWAKHNIRVNSVSPGLVETAMTYWVPQQPDWEQQLKYYGGMPRLAQVQELGGAYVYLLSDAASYTTSIDIPVNGVIGSAYYSSPTVAIRGHANRESSLLSCMWHEWRRMQSKFRCFDHAMMMLL
jgi:Enoyl-(Acyl carrier protein) reductase